MTDQRRDVVAVVGEDRDSDAGLDLDREPCDDDRLGELLPELLGQVATAACGVADARCEDAELVAAQPRDRVALAQRACADAPRPR